MSGKSTSPLSRLFAGKRAGTALIIGGTILAAPGLLHGHRHRPPLTGRRGEAVKQVYVVTATREIPQFTAVQADALTIKAFPAAFAPAGVATKIEDVEGKFAATTIARDQILLTSQVTATRRTSNLSASVPPGKVAFWMPLPELLVQSGGLQAGDKVDILLSLELSVDRARVPSSRKRTTRSPASPPRPPCRTWRSFSPVRPTTPTSRRAPAPPPGARAGGATATRQTASKVVAFLLDPQDAVLAKWVKDSGGTMDLVLRSDADKDAHATKTVNADTVVDGYRFRVPEQWNLRKQ